MTQGDANMEKLTLNVDALTVESFAAADKPRTERGSVQAHEAPETQQFRCTYFCTYNCTGLEC
jgi:hypothetical protein